MTETPNESEERAARIVVVTQQVDPAHPALAATVPKLRALAERADELDVLALAGSSESLPENCRLRLFGGRLKPLRGLRFLRALAAELRRKPRPDLVLAHMCPIYAVLAAPLARPLGVPVVLWYTHWRRTPTLRLAHRLVNVIASVDERSVPFRSRKVRAIGHGIDPAEFPCAPPRPGDGTLRALVLGRYSEAKGLETILEAVKLALERGLDPLLTVHGPALTGAEVACRERLVVRRDELGLGERVTLGEAQPRSEVPRLLAENDILINNMEEGALDKVVFEAAASCRPVLASNSGFDRLLPPELRFSRSSAEELAGRLTAFARLTSEERAALGRGLRERVAASHSVQSWARGIIELER
jgi:glycosyltransferase involved in cell wall biosynthesis